MPKLASEFGNIEFPCKERITEEEKKRRTALPPPGLAEEDGLLLLNPQLERAQSSPGEGRGRLMGRSGQASRRQTVSTLHKQNFDLKLELYHRRERQTTLEEKVEQLASEKEQLEEVNDRLLEELEKRDKAVQEAVQMIVLLEARVEKLVEEREMVRQVETAGYLAKMDASLDAPDSQASHCRSHPARGGRQEAQSYARVLCLKAQKQQQTYATSTSHRRRDHEPSRPARGPRSGSFSRSGSGQYQSITDVIEQSSPLQRLERLEGYASNGASPSTDKVARTRSQSQSKTKQEKREALRRVMTDAPSPNGRSHFDQALPPTPDTISTSTLRRFKNSSGDTLVQQPNTTTNERSFLASSSQRAGEKPEPVAEHNGGAPIMPPSATTTRYEADFAHHGHGRPLKPQPRPRSADESTISHRRSKAWLQENGDEDDNASIMSLESSLDIWMQQGKEPKQVGRTSPDLFGFPTKTGGWETDAMFGPGASYGGGGAPLSWPDPLEDLVPIQQALFGGPGAPPPPNRRSSLHARTGSASTSRHPEPVMGKLRKSFGRRRDSTDSQMQANEAGPHTPQQTSEKQGQGQGRGPYPPFTRPATATPRDGRMKTLWRRSLGGTGSAPPPNASDLVPEPAVSTTPTGRQSINNGVGTPSWVHRAHMIDDDTRALGATPPPIQRQPRRGSMVEHEGAPVFDRGPSTPTMSVAPSLPSTPSGKGPTTSDSALAGAPGPGGGGGGGAGAGGEFL
ncbi:conserved hypothetical protein [Verticillium alfalfae VaMs.102]|uniref:Centrosomin N-terminal motif 1 domain-containing protein n=1 Tax=Verticillium alfalfae (strain VaMs.102 / ATCC MYA-4576 / FGSC 10136) TaxID=526221 RepID=C9SCM0_VERA1|nr:conserved hypothetical protein [Verticillium alfalfae VaMs.102]EEY16835.1 conserved hypothetical protein [Verticillium alfalfae VaMs.102]